MQKYAGAHSEFLFGERLHIFPLSLHTSKQLPLNVNNHFGFIIITT